MALSMGPSSIQFSSNQPWSWKRGKHHGFFLQVVLSHFRVKEVADAPQLLFITALESVFLDALDQLFECIEVSVNTGVGVV